MLAVNHVSHLAGIYKQGFAFLLLAFRDKPQCNRNCDAVEKLCRHGDNALDQVILYDLLSYFTLAA